LHLPSHHWIHRVLRVLVFVLALVAAGGFGAGSDWSDPGAPDIVLDSTDPAAEFTSSADGPDLEEVMMAHVPGGSPGDVPHALDDTVPSTHVDAPCPPPDRPPSLA
jgi:hypothetical protein